MDDDKTLQVIIDEQKIAKANAEQLIAAFGAPFTEAGEILATYTDIVVTDESQTDLIAEAKTKRLTLKKIRTTVENKRKELKEDSLRTGKAIDGVARYIKDHIQPAEDYLELQEKFIDIKQAERENKLKAERIEKLLQYTDNPYVYEFLGTMREEDFQRLFEDQRALFLLKQAQEKAYAEQQDKIRLDKEAEDARIREENEILKQQAAAREAEMEKEREELRIVQEAELRAEREKAENERAKRELLEKQQADKLAQEQLSQELKEKTDLARQNAPDRMKLVAFARTLEDTRYNERPTLNGSSAQELLAMVEEALENIQTMIIEGVKEL